MALTLINKILLEISHLGVSNVKRPRNVHHRLSSGISAVFLFSKALKIQEVKIGFAGRKKQAFLCLVVFAASFLGTLGIYAFYDKIWVRTTLTADPIYVFRAAIAIAILLLPMLIVLRYSRGRSAGVGLTQKRLGKNLAFGALVSVILVGVLAVLSPGLGGGYAGFN
jgi:hypothetical protein